jgi:hypothetical protein
MKRRKVGKNELVNIHMDGGTEGRMEDKRG